MDYFKSEVTADGRAVKRFDPSKPCRLYTDWSNRGIGAVLCQFDDDGQEHIVAAISRSLNKHERNYSSPKGETLAAVWAVQTLRHFLLGVQFTIVTDHSALKQLLGPQQLEGQFARWSMILMEYSFEVEHRPGNENVNADYLSRCPRTDDADGSGARLDPVPDEGAVPLLNLANSCPRSLPFLLSWPCTLLSCITLLLTWTN